ncbi:MAG: ABC transporter permease [Acidimicrobiales bacterium]
MTAIRRLNHQVGFDLVMFRRNPAAAFFTLILPLIFFLLFTAIFGNETNEAGVRIATYYVPGIMTLQITSATLVNLAMAMTTRRERGLLKRLRATPLPPWVFIASQATASIVISAVASVFLIVVGRLVFDVSVRAAGVPSLVVSIALGSACLAALGLALSTIIPSEEAAPAITNVLVLPLYFISDVFIPGDKPRALEFIASLFPVQHLATALQPAFDPLAVGVTWPWRDWLVLAAWGLFGVAVARSRFRWVPSR